MSGDWMDSFLEETQVPQVKRRPWMDECEMILGTRENTDAIIDECIQSGVYAIDLETSGLDNRVFNGRTMDHIAGICLSPDGVKGYYIPVRHDLEKYGEHNVPGSVWRPAMKRLVDSPALAVFHNGKFDQEFLQFNGGEPLGEWDQPKTWDDTLILAYLRNTRAKTIGLKSLAEAPPDATHEHQCGGPGLGCEMIKLHELWGHETEKSGFKYDFTTLDPSWAPSLWYASSDAIMTFRLYELLKKEGEEQRTIHLMEKLCVAATRWMERNRICVSQDKVLELIKLGQQEWFDSIMELYEEASKILERDIMPGHYKLLRDIFRPDDTKFLVPEQLIQAKAQSQQRYPDPKGVIKSRGKEWPSIYDVSSAQQLGNMFAEMRVPGLKYTEKTGQVVTKKEVLNEIIEKAGKKFPFMGKVKRFRETWKALGSYLYPMLLDVEPSDNTMRINFQQHRVDTGRFSTPSKDDARAEVPGWPQLNLQSMPATYDPKRPACMTRLRECIVARSGYFLVAIDYAGVELRIVTNLSREPKWLSEFFHCASCDRTFERGDGRTTPSAPPPRCPDCGSDKIGDLHTLTALEIYGQDAVHKSDWKKLRGNAKATNFALCYGGGGNAVVRATECDKNEGWRIKNQFDQTYRGLKSWWDGQHTFARNHGYVLTGFGRKYPVPDITNADGFFRSKAERNSVNGPVQGTSADITKIAMGLIYKECKKRGWLDDVKMIITMHDELVFEIKGERIEEAIDVIVPIMTSNSLILGKKWPIPLTTDVEIGYDWTNPWDVNAMRAGEVRFLNGKKYKQDAQIPVGMRWEDLHPIDGKDPDQERKWKAHEYKKKDQIPEGVRWETIPNFPEPLSPLFKRKTLTGVPDPSEGGTPGGTPPRPDDGGPGGVSVSVPVMVEEEDDVDLDEIDLDDDDSPAPAPAIQRMEMSPASNGDVFTYRVEAPLTLTTVMKLADLIRQCRNGGTKVLHLCTASGESLDGWREVFGHAEVRVSSDEFAILAKAARL